MRGVVRAIGWVAMHTGFKCLRVLRWANRTTDRIDGRTRRPGRVKVR